MAVAGLAHPARAGQMGVVNDTGALGFGDGIDAEYDAHDLAPVGIVAGGVE